MELIVEAKIRPKIIPIVNNIYKHRGAHRTVDELTQYARKFMSINYDRFVCDIENCIDLQRKGQLLVSKALEIGDVDVHNIRVLSFTHDWENHELSFTFRIFFQPKSENIEVQLEQLSHYIFKWMRAEGAYIGLGKNKYWGDNEVICTFDVEIDESDIDVIALMSEE